MKKQIISIYIIISLIATSLSACSNGVVSEQKNVETTTINNSSYYSITNAKYLNSENDYMTLNVKIPKIVCSNDENNSLFDEINEELEKNINSIVNEAKSTAKKTYESYLKTAKNNAIKDRNDKIKKLLTKYEGIITNDDKDFLDFIIKEDSGAEPKMIPRKVASTPSNIRRDNFDNAPNTKSNEKVPMNREPNKVPRSGSGESKNSSSDKKDSVSGFTNSEDLIIPGLHNKNIIVVETTEAETVKSNTNTVSSSEKGSERPSGGMGNRPKGMPNGDKKRATMSDAKSSDAAVDNADDTADDTVYSDVDAALNDFNEKRPGRENVGPRMQRPLRRQESVGTRSNTTPTIDDFYMELEDILRFSNLTDRELKMSYTKTSINCEFYVLCLDKDYLSLYVDFSTSRTTKSDKRYYYNVDLNQKKMLKISDLLGENYKDICANSIKRTIENWSNDEKNALTDNYDIDSLLTEDVSFFINNNHVPVVVFDKYAITAGGSIGYPEFLIEGK